MGSHPSSAEHAESAAGQKPASTASIVAMVARVPVLICGAIYLFRTNPAAGTWAQGYDPTGHWWLSTILAALPIIVLLGSLALGHIKAHYAALAGLAAALLTAI